MLKCHLGKFCLVFASIIMISACSSSDKKFVDRMCGSCHTTAVVYDKHFSENQWYNVIRAMKVHGMISSPQEDARMVEYLTKHHGPKK